jgi:hypothetical protein
MQQSNSPIGDDGTVQGTVKRKIHTKPYVIEHRYVGTAKGWMAKYFKQRRDWHVHSRFAKAADRDHEMDKLRRDDLMSKYWEYRAVDQ